MEPDIEVFELDLDRRSDIATVVREWLENLPVRIPEDVPLLTHELVTNSLRHTHSPRIWVTLLSLPEAIRVEVTDEGGGRPRISKPEAFAESGRGLVWLRELSEDWGIEPRARTHVWFQVDRVDSTAR
jgi:anti-sigma regulatory factor (Ser/Thr protein kinase)